MTAKANFSSVVMLTDLDDFINPSQECVKPVQTSTPVTSGSAKIQIGEDGKHTQTINGKTEKLERAKITLNDCLACSGCITSAETVLIGEQSHSEFLKVCQEIKANSESRLNLGAMRVYDVESFSDLCLKECGQDFVQRFKEKHSQNDLPVLASACPGWICYAEKTHGNWILPHISEIKSPQQLAGKYLKDVLPNEMETASRIAVAMVMPCFDKKLEASRNDFLREDQLAKDVDYVITPVEIEQILDELEIDFMSLESSHVDPLVVGAESNTWTVPSGSGSGGFAEHVFRYAAKELFGSSLASVEFKTAKNSDVREAVLMKDGEQVLSVAIINGFKNIQNLVQKMKRKKCTYDYVEVMACPSGCLNGGAQLRPNLVESKTLVAQMGLLYAGLPQRNVDEARAEKLASVWSPGESVEEHSKKVKNQIPCGAQINECFDSKMVITCDLFDGVSVVIVVNKSGLFEYWSHFFLEA
nr:EOG090X05AC [Scapholeberis mucronata]